MSTSENDPGRPGADEPGGYPPPGSNESAGHPPTGWQPSGSYPPPTANPGAYHPGGVPQPGGHLAPTSEERNWALGAHIGTLVAAWFAMGFLAPLLVLLMKGKDSPFVRRHAVESLNFQISLLIYLVVCGILVLLLVGLFLLIALGIFALVVIILATMAASNGQDYRYPLTIRLVS